MYQSGHHERDDTNYSARCTRTEIPLVRMLIVHNYYKKRYTGLFRERYDPCHNIARRTI